MKYIIILGIAVAALVTPLVSRSKQTRSIRNAERVLLQAQVQDELKDPGSAEFADMQMYRQGQTLFTLCGSVNAKNGFGGYVGYTRFVAWRMFDPTDRKMISSVRLDGEGFRHDIYEREYSLNCHDEAAPQ
jgi:hypothetical protein